MEKVNGVCLDIRALTKIHDAMKVLNQDGIIQRDPNAAAEAFGDLFSGFGRLAHHLPPPANAYAQIIEGCSADFFKGFVQAGNPETRASQRDMWKQVEM